MACVLAETFEADMKVKHLQHEACQLPKASDGVHIDEIQVLVGGKAEAFPPTRLAWLAESPPEHPLWTGPMVRPA